MNFVGNHPQVTTFPVASDFVLTTDSETGCVVVSALLKNSLVCCILIGLSNSIVTNVGCSKSDIARLTRFREMASYKI